MASVNSDIEGEIVELREEVQTYKPGSNVTSPDRIRFPDSLYIGLFGRTGCGKTSLINSLKFAASGRLRRAKWLQVANQEKAGGHTMFRKLANLTASIFVIDNRGLDTPDTDEAVLEIAAQLDGKRGYSERVEWQAAGDDDQTAGLLDLTDEDTKAGHHISCAVFVFSAKHDIDTNTTGLMEVVDFLHGHQGRYPMAVITHVDVAEAAHVEDLKTVLRVCGVSDVFEVANITSEKAMLEETYQYSLLSLIERCMTHGDETIIFKHYQRKEEERKAMLVRRRQEKEQKEREQKQTEEQKMQEKCREGEQRRRDITKSGWEDHRHLEAERLHLEYQMRLEQERFKHEMEMERQRVANVERDRQAKEREREERFREVMRTAEAEKQLEIMRIMQANRSPLPGVSCSLM